MNASETIAIGHALHQLYYHFAWSTHSRTALIRRDYRQQGDEDRPDPEIPPPEGGWKEKKKWTDRPFAPDVNVWAREKRRKRLG
jgi:hypothetical protein